MITNLLIVLVNGALEVADAVAAWFAALIGLAIVIQFARWEIAFDRHLARGLDGQEELL